MNTGTILEISCAAMLLGIFCLLLWLAKRKQGLANRYAVALGLVFILSLGMVLLCRTEMVSSIGYNQPDDK